MALWVRQFGDVCCRYTLESTPQSTCVMHTHDVLEIYYFISGDCTYLIEGTAYALRPGDIIFKRPLEAHKLVVNSSEVPYERIGITLPIDRFRGLETNDIFEAMMRRPLGTGNRFTAEDFGHTRCEDMMREIARRGETMSHAEFLSHIFLIATEADRVLRQKGNAPHKEQRASTVATRLIDYTNEHLYSEFSLTDLCQQFFLSYSQINRIFKQHTGSTACRYITTKRLLTARDRIRHGAPPAEACYSCGYNDYSTFYRAYVQQFGHAPKADQGVPTSSSELLKTE